MISKEQIELFCDGLMSEIADDTKPYLDALCDAALSWLAIQPRPISEAPKDGTEILAFNDASGEWRIVKWAEWLGHPVWVFEVSPGEFGAAYGDLFFQRFIPLSALPGVTKP